MMLALAILLCLATGLSLVRWGFPARLRFDTLLLQCALAVGYGLGVFSINFFLSRVFAFPHLLSIDAVVLAAILLAAFLFRLPHVSLTSLVHRDVAPWLQRTLTLAVAISLVAALYSAISRAFAHPHGSGWDAFAIWNLHARFLFRGGSHWRDGFSPLIPWSHPDYPLLLPAAVAHFWTCLGRDSTAVPTSLALVFTFGTIALLFAGLSILRGRVPALLGVLVLLTTPAFIDLGTWQYADIPLSFFYLATVILLNLYGNRTDFTLDDNSPDDKFPLEADHDRAQARLLALAGLSAAFAAWTKNEGVLFLCAILAAKAIVSFHDHRDRGASSASSSFTPFLAAAAPIFLVIAYFKHFIAPPGDLFSTPAIMLHKLADPSRYWANTRWYFKDFFRFGSWQWIPIPPLLIIYYFIAGRVHTSRNNVGFRISALALGLTLAGYFAIFLITPYDIYWHLRFSLDRLFLQLWPSAIFLYFASVNLPAEK